MLTMHRWFKIDRAIEDLNYEPIITYEIENVQENPLVFRMDGVDNNSEYYLFENRQKILYDRNLPHHGLFIWHINESAGGNQNDWNRLVDLEQADGYYHLNTNGNSGDPGDPFPGFSNNSIFAYFKFLVAVE